MKNLINGYDDDDDDENDYLVDDEMLLLEILGIRRMDFSYELSFL